MDTKVLLAEDRSCPHSFIFWVMHHIQRQDSQGGTAGAAEENRHRHDHRYHERQAQ